MHHCGHFQVPALVARGGSDARTAHAAPIVVPCKDIFKRLPFMAFGRASQAAPRRMAAALVCTASIYIGRTGRRAPRREISLSSRATRHAAPTTIKASVYQVIA